MRKPTDIRWGNSLVRYRWLRELATTYTEQTSPPFHGGNTGSNPVGDVPGISCKDDIGLDLPSGRDRGNWTADVVAPNTLEGRPEETSGVHCEEEWGRWLPRKTALPRLGCS